MNYSPKPRLIHKNPTEKHKNYHLEKKKMSSCPPKDVDHKRRKKEYFVESIIGKSEKKGNLKYLVYFKISLKN